ncbi:hypothetical protein [Frankia gtarii]|uniref:hypothetical protein n=1 Tax=Frankia gtarii TaxID=2950102 RepID=UPI0021BE3652|nr:hypothetical protein [Frankia gtarii]
MCGDFAPLAAVERLDGVRRWRRAPGLGDLRAEPRGGARRPAMLLLALGVLVGCLVAAGPAALAGPVPPAAVNAAAPGSAAGAVPAGTISRSGAYLIDGERRVVVIRGMTVPAGVIPTTRDLDSWIGYGFSGVRLAVPVAAGGHFPVTAGWPAPDAAAGASADPGLGQVASLARTFTGRGLRVVLRLVPAVRGQALSSATLAAGLGRLATRLHGEPGLLGYEVPAVVGTGGTLADAVIAQDSVHLLWRDRPAPFDAAATVAVNDPTGYLVGWKDGSSAALRGLVAAADAFGLSWFYDAPSGAGGTVGTDPPPALGGGSLQAAPAEIVRPYPVAVAGTPESLRFDAARVLTVTFRTASPTGSSLAAGAATAISLPAWSYPQGYQVQATGARVTSAPGAGLLCVVAEPGAARVEVRVAPAIAGPRVSAPATAGAGGCAPSPGSAAALPGGSGAPAAASARSENDEDYSGPLLLVLPLVGAAAAAVLLALVLRPWRRRAVRSAPNPVSVSADPPGRGD